MSEKRTQYSSEFKAEAALTAIRKDGAPPQLAARYGIHLAQINSRKRPLIEQAAELFSRIIVLAKGMGKPQAIYIMSLGN